MSVRRVNRTNGTVAYEVRWREGKRNRARRFDLKRDADAFDRELARRRQLGPLAVQQLTVKGPTLADWIATRWAPEHASQLEESTRELYARNYADRVEHHLGHLPLQELTVGRLREWQTELLRAGVSPHGVLKARVFLSSVLRHAAESEAIPGNPLSLVRAPRQDHKEEVQPLVPLLIEEIRALLQPRDAAIVSVLAYSGLRPGEMRGLRWQEVRERTLLIHRAATPAGKAKAVKNRRYRTVRLLATLVEDLAAWRDTAPSGAARALVWPRSDGEIWTRDDWDNWREDVWRPVCREVGLDPIPRPYDLRHSFASLLLAEGKTVHEVAQQLGHSAEQTLRTYGHVIDEYAGLGPGERPVAEDEIRKAREQLAGSDVVARVARRRREAERVRALRRAEALLARREARLAETRDDSARALARRRQKIEEARGLVAQLSVLAEQLDADTAG